MSRLVYYVTALAVVAIMIPLAAVAADGGVAAQREEPATALLDAARALSASLESLRALPAASENAAEAVRLRSQVRVSFDRLLDVAGLTPEEFVELVNSDGGVDRGHDPEDRPVFRALPE